MTRCLQAAQRGRRLLLSVLALCWALSPLTSFAQYGRWYDERAARQQAQQQPYPGRHGPPHDTDRHGGDRRGGMSPDERRELRRDLERANQEIYRKGKDRKPQR